jgi:hypothetical protein
LLADSFEGCDYVTPDMINNQVIKLNQAFNPSNFNFQLATTDYTNRTLWCGPLQCQRIVPHPVHSSPAGALSMLCSGTVGAFSPL